MTVTQIDAGTQHNVVPDRCNFVVDIRSNEKYSNEEIFRDRSAKNVKCTISPPFDAFGFISYTFGPSFCRKELFL